VKVLKEILKLRKQDKDERDEQESLLEGYVHIIQQEAQRVAAEGLPPTWKRQAAWATGAGALWKKTHRSTCWRSRLTS
jgi:hypothetical protein